MNVILFKFLTVNDNYDDFFNDGNWAWSRIYEYPIVLEHIKKLSNNNSDIKIHNTSFGFTGVHLIFKNKLDSLYKNCIHSDIRHSELPKTLFYDITKKPSDNLIEQFDIVINVSTLEEVNHDHWDILNNLMLQVKKNGYLIITFDYPGLNLQLFEEKLNTKIIKNSELLNGKNSILQNLHFSYLNVGILILQKI